VVTRALLLLAILLSDSTLIFEDAEFWRVSEKTRENYIRLAKVWRQTDIPRMNILAGPPSEIAVPFEAEVRCEYVEPHLKSRGYSPKFTCRLLPKNEKVRIKFGSHEANAEIAGTRLHWALGFYADHDYPVRLRCLKCPEKNPAWPSREEKRLDRLLEDTIMEENFTGKEIGVYPDQGWNWQEINLVDEKLGGASRAEVDALKLLAVFVQHMDSKHEQQRLACNPEDIDYWVKTSVCKKPYLMIQDLGETFGQSGKEITADSAMSLSGWNSQNIWNESKEKEFANKNQGARVCIGNLTAAQFAEGDGLSDPIISEDGRELLANLLNQLSDAQIHDLFRAARAERTGEMIEVQGKKRAVTIEDWVNIFKKKREQINQRSCR
jgi:hypothetical protein